MRTNVAGRLKIVDCRVQVKPSKNNPQVAPISDLKSAIYNLKFRSHAIMQIGDFPIELCHL